MKEANGQVDPYVIVMTLLHCIVLWIKRQAGRQAGRQAREALSPFEEHPYCLKL